jgi:alpha-D-xyloside xylohydrolase
MSDRTGSFPGMLESRTFNITLVDNTKGGHSLAATKPDQVVTYTGKKTLIKL